MTPQEIAEEWQLIQSAQKNIQRFGPLYNKYYDSVFGFIYNRIHDEETTADICSLTFAKVIEKLSTYQFQGRPFGGWLFTIALNEVNQHYRRSKKNKVVILEDSYAESIKDEIGNAEELEINLLKLEKAILMLSPEEMEMVRMRFFEKMNFRDIGEILGIKENNAKVKNFRVVEKLKEIFKKIKT
jgi:RNA polymerase sigma-70 factor (ECF subfamily)